LAVGAALIQRSMLGRSSPGPPRPGPVVLWTTDRDAHRVYGLDADLLVARRVELDWPLEVESCRDGGAWVLRSGDGTPTGSCRLDRIADDGSVAFEVAVGRCTDLAALEARFALVIEKGSGANGVDRLLRLGDEGGQRVLFETSDLSCVADSRAAVAVGTERGEVVRLDPRVEGAVLDRVHLGGRVLDLAPGPSPGSLWVLVDEGGARLHLLGPDLALCWAVDVGLAAGHLAPIEGEERVWLADTLRPVVRRFGPGGVLEVERTDLPLAGLDRAVAWSGGGVLLAAPGAILHLDRGGRLRPGQGGFDFLVDLDRAPGSVR
jgi:hypothetical protein